MAELGVVVNNTGEPGILGLSGELDYSGVTAVRRQLSAIDGDLSVVCAELSFIDAAGLGMFVEVHQRCEARGVKLLLIEPSSCMQRLLELTGLDELFQIQTGGHVA